MERITFAGTLDALDGIRRVVKAQAEEAGLARKPTYNLLLAVDEIATNIITHGYEENNLSGPVDLLTDCSNECFTVVLEDEAPAFDPLHHQLPTDELFARPLEERPIGGMGIHLTIKGVDKFSYEYLGGRNRNIFCMNVPELPPAP
ncbi:ATP-binding protein [Hymenobacter sp. RP-2-7]|uniref:ATP-binding protein n=1 Tax=Hymenobacter polaris TaxID=2682546 RepID=A0A7Y0FL24_9BACT|nr:ATP-binding protein [Hymenobacter polaris]NML64392.1 ATP-binding protein [Hymenobacter polaris]